MLRPSLSEFQELAQTHNLIPVYREVTADLETPISVFLKLCRDDQPCFLLESVEGGERVARYSFIGCRPFLEVVHEVGATRVVEVDPATVQPKKSETLQGSPLEHMRQVMARFKAPHLPGLPRFYGGGVGYLGYDTVRYVERLPSPPPDDLGVPTAAFMFTELVAIFDHVKHKLLLVANVQPNGAAQAAYERAGQILDRAVERLRGPVPLAGGFQEAPGRTLQVESNTTQAAYEAKVKQAKEYIRAGDIFQVIVSLRLSAETSAPPFDLYRTLRGVNPSPYMFYLSFGNRMKLVGASPEMMVRVEEGRCFLRPIAGTRRRGATEEEDARIERELLQDEKERAEHVMLVDLGRNDIGRVCRFGSVEVKKLMYVERYSHVMHIVSDVYGELQEGKDAFDTLAATFPAGTLSGAPKVRAMEIIDELETTRRGPYGGAVGYFAFTGNMDTCITIRTMLVRGGRVYVQAGAGVVADSDPTYEYQECLHKAEALLRTLRIVEEGI